MISLSMGTNNFCSDLGQKVFVVLISAGKKKEKVPKLTDAFISKSISTDAFTLV